MNFLHPWALALAALAAAPILIHLLRRDVAQRIAFPALRYLRRAEQRTARTMRLRDQFLLATRILLILLLAAAAARPLAGRGGAKDHDPTDGLLIIDNSASMSRVREGRTLLDYQIEAARSALEMAGPTDRFWVAPVVGTVLATGVSAQEAALVLRSIEITDASGDIINRLTEVTAAVPVRQDRIREAHVYTDGQASALSNGPLDLSAWGPVVIGMSSDQVVSNGTVSSLRLDPDGMVVPGDPTAVAAHIEQLTGAGESDAAPDTVDVRLIVDGQTAAMTRASWGSEAILALPDLEAGPHTVRVETPPSGMRSDDGRQIGLMAAENPVVRLSGDPSGFVGKALQTLWNDGRIRSEAGGARATIEIVEGTAQPRGTGNAALLLIPPKDLTDLPAFQQRLSSLGVPWRLTVRPSSGSILLEDPPNVAGLTSVRISSAYYLERQASPPTPVDSVLIRTTDNAPWLIRGRTGNRVFLLLASPFDPEATDLPTGVAMIPFLEQVLLRWSRHGQEPTWSAIAGSPVSLPARAEEIVSPDGESSSVEGGAPWTPRHAGTWMVRSANDDGSVDLWLGVNVPTSESDMQPASEAELEAAFAGSQVEIVKRPGDWPAAVFMARRGAEATPWLLGAVLLLVLVELLLAAPERIARH